MKRLLFIALLFVAFDSFSQPLNYTRIANRYRWISGMFDSALYVPRYNGTPSGVRVGENSAIDGAIAIDTANHRAYIYSGGAWVRLANYSEVGGTYTAGDGLLLTASDFKVLTKRSITIDSDSLMLVNDSTASPSLYSYRINAAGRKGWYPDNTLIGVNIYNSDGTLTGERTVTGDGNNLTITGLAALNIDGTEPFNIQVSSGGSTGVLTVDGGNNTFASTRTGATSTFKVDEDSIVSKPHIGAYYIDTLAYTLSTTGKKILIRDTATGLVQNIDPALLTVSGVTAGSQGQIYQTSNGAAAWKYDTTTLVTLSAGARFQADTALFTDSTLYGSFYLDGNDTLIITKIRAVMNGGTSDTLGLKISYNDTINVDGTRIKTADIAINSTTTGNETTSFDNPKIPPGNWVWLKSPAVVAGRKPYYLSVSIIGYKKRVN